MDESNMDHEDMALLGPMTQARIKKLSEDLMYFLTNMDHNLKVERQV